MKASEEVRIQYAEKYSSSYNYYKYYSGQTEQLKKLKVLDKKLEIEKAFSKWYNTDSKLKDKYGSVLNDIKQ